MGSISQASPWATESRWTDAASSANACAPDTPKSARTARSCNADNTRANTAAASDGTAAESRPDPDECAP